jgi:hypothetical protein
MVWTSSSPESRHIGSGRSDRHRIAALPTPEVEDFLIAPTRAARQTCSAEMPEVEWTVDDLRQLREAIANATVHATMDPCAAEPEAWIPSEALQTVTSRERTKHRGDYGGFAITLGSRFGRSNTPYQMQYGVGGRQPAVYRLNADMAARWKAVTTGTGGSNSTEER